MNEKIKSKLKKEILSDNFKMYEIAGGYAAYRCLIPDMQGEECFSEHGCFEIIKSNPEAMKRIIERYRTEEGTYIYAGIKYAKEDMIKLIFESGAFKRRKGNIYG